MRKIKTKEVFVDGILIGIFNPSDPYCSRSIGEALKDTREYVTDEKGRKVVKERKIEFVEVDVISCKLKKKVTEKQLLKGAKICKKHGYHSTEVTAFLDRFTSKARIKMSSALGSVYNSKSFQASMYYGLFKENGLIE